MTLSHITQMDPTSTGKFGLGFNSVYHLSDMPFFVSGEVMCLLEPHKVKHTIDFTPFEAPPYNRALYMFYTHIAVLSECGRPAIYGH